MKKIVFFNFVCLAVIPLISYGSISCSNKLNKTFSFIFNGCPSLDVSNTTISNDKNFETTLSFDNNFYLTNIVIYSGNKQLISQKDYVYNFDTNHLVIFKESINSDVRAWFYFAKMLPIPISSLIIDRTEDALMLKGVGEDIDLSLYNTLLIPDDITEISDGAFYKKFSNFSNINNIIFNNNLKSIGKFAFADCTSLTCKINLPSGLTSLGEKAFFNCSNISSELIIPPWLEEIPSYAFAGCKHLTGSLTIPDNVKIIGDNAFMNCTSLSGVLKLSSSLKSINDFAFANCAGFTDIDSNNSNNLESIGSSAFLNLVELTSINFPLSLRTIGDSAFKNCSKIQSLVFPNFIKEINKFTFAGCKGITTVAFSSNIENVYDGAFEDCANLQSVVFPSNLVAIHNSAFAGCRALEEVKFLSNKITKISESTFAGCIALNKITLPSTVTSIGAHAFEKCKSLENINFPDGLVLIGDYAFNECTKLKTINLNNNNKLKTIGNYAFANCQISLQDKKFPLPDSIQTIGDYAFYDTFSREATITTNIPKSIVNVGSYAFATSHTDDGKYTFSFPNGFDQPTSIETIGDYAFLQNEFYNGIAFSAESLISVIPTGAFMKCKIKSKNDQDLPIINLSGLHISMIGEYAFSSMIAELYHGGWGGCTLQMPPKSIYEIGNYAFAYSNYALSSQFSGFNNVSKIGSYAFLQCYSFLNQYQNDKDPSLKLPYDVDIAPYAFKDSGVHKFSVEEFSMKHIPKWMIEAKQKLSFDGIGNGCPILPEFRYIYVLDDTFGIAVKTFLCIDGPFKGWTVKKPWELHKN